MKYTIFSSYTLYYLGDAPFIQPYYVLISDGPRSQSRAYSMDCLNTRKPIRFRGVGVCVDIYIYIYICISGYKSFIYKEYKLCCARWRRPDFYQI